MRILFICKKNETYGFYSGRHSGLYNSTSFIVSALLKEGIHAKIVEVVDNNDIDREVSLFRPSKVILEALWVIPEKFRELKTLHPWVAWFVHLHSHIPFLASEGIAMDWLPAYCHLGIGIIANSEDSTRALRVILDSKDVIYLPNIYSDSLHKVPSPPGDVDTLWIGSFGAVRPMKNQLIQAMAALEFAKQKKKKLRFYINGTRVETDGSCVIKNIRSLFSGNKNAELFETSWFGPDDFISTLTMMDMGLQVSLSETFNVVSADYVAAGIPMVVSSEIKWASSLSQASSSDMDDILRKMHRAFKYPWIIKYNRWLLNRFSDRSKRLWVDFCIEERVPCNLS